MGLLAMMCDEVGQGADEWSGVLWEKKCGSGRGQIECGAGVICDEKGCGDGDPRKDDLLHREERKRYLYLGGTESIEPTRTSKQKFNNPSSAHWIGLRVE